MAVGPPDEKGKAGNARLPLQLQVSSESVAAQLATILVEGDPDLGTANLRQ